MEQKLCVDRKEAASMVDLSPRAFDGAVAAGLFPSPIKVGRRSLWSTKALAMAVDQLAGLEADSDAKAMEALGKWKKNRAMSSAEQ